VQFIDVRDLGAWIVDLCEQRRTGTFNATRPGVSWGEMLATSQHSVGGEAQIVWLPDDFLREQEVGEWMELPLWIADPRWRGCTRSMLVVPSLPVSPSGHSMQPFVGHSSTRHRLLMRG
jgi:2'-hydroxyisoflavone reductase